MRGRNSLRNVDMIDSSWSSLYRLKHTQGSSPTNQITAIIIGYYYCIPCNNLLLINSALYHFVLYPRKQNHIYCIFNTTTVEQQLSWLNSGRYYKLRTNPIVQIPAVIRPVWVDYNDVVNCDRVVIIMLPLELSIKFMARATLSINICGQIVKYVVVMMRGVCQQRYLWECTRILFGFVFENSIGIQRVQNLQYRVKYSNKYSYEF